MKAVIAELYAEIFLFLSDLLDYLLQKRRKRLLDSFNEDLFNKFEDQISNIEKKAAKVQRLAAQGSRAELRATRLELENVKQHIIAGQKGEARLRAELTARADRLEAELARAREQRKHEMLCMRQLSTSIKKMLGDNAQQAVVEARTAAGE
jgi:chaperonin cofactor prefoldin